MRKMATKSGESIIWRDRATPAYRGGRRQAYIAVDCVCQVCDKYSKENTDEETPAPLCKNPVAADSSASLFQDQLIGTGSFSSCIASLSRLLSCCQRSMSKLAPS